MSSETRSEGPALEGDLWVVVRDDLWDAQPGEQLMVRVETDPWPLMSDDIYSIPITPEWSEHMYYERQKYSAVWSAIRDMYKDPGTLVTVSTI